MLPPRELAQLLAKKFGEKRSASLPRALTELLIGLGALDFEAAEQAEKMAPSVRRLLLAMRQEDLPFEFGRSDPMRLVGKGLARTDENPETLFARQARACLDGLHTALWRCSDFDFEVVCAAALAKSGASCVFATCSGDDGGIDLYGRLPLRPPDPAVRPGLLQTSLLPQEILVLGQCKRYAQGARIGRSELQKFHAAVEDCLKKYEGNARPPSHRVPDKFYRRGEICIRVFITTAEYTDTAEGEAESNDIFLVYGRQLAEFLVMHQVGLDKDSDSGYFVFNEEAFSNWLQEACLRHKRQI